MALSSYDEYKKALEEEERYRRQREEYMRRQMYQSPYYGGGGGMMPVYPSAIPLGPLGDYTEKRKIDPKKIDALKKAEPRKVGLRQPDGFIPGVAWRGWKAKNVGGEWRLGALGRSSDWEPKKAIEAECGNGKEKHPAPHFDCTCGIWSFQTLEKLVPALDSYEVLVLGQVSIWGRIIETENGFRSQFAYPKELWLIDNKLEQLGYTYGVPVRSL